jgi:hypothetical protein
MSALNRIKPWIPSTPGEWGCALVIFIAVSLLISVILALFKGLWTYIF